jgi:tryptophan synthase alpha chain
LSLGRSVARSLLIILLITMPTSRIDTIFATLRREGRTALMPFVTAGDPSLEVTGRLLTSLPAAGASIIELGIPFSDPIADGPVIAASMHRALEAGVTPRRVFEMVRNRRDEVDAGLLAMVSDSIVQRIGPDRFVDDALAAGFDGLIVPDIDLDAAASISDRAGAGGLSFSLLVAPTTTADRLERIAPLCRGFIYMLARAGLTGEQRELPPIAPRIAEIRRVSDLPIAVGFGISGAEHVAAVTRVADAAIVGSALVRRLHETRDPVKSATAFVEELAQGLQRRETAERAGS